MPLTWRDRLFRRRLRKKSLNTLNNEILHLSFQALVADEKVNSVIHILLANEEKAGNQLEKMMMEIPYASLPADMIDTITIDLDGMAVGTVVMVKDIPELMSDTIELRADPEEIVLRISDKTYQVPRQRQMNPKKHRKQKQIIKTGAYIQETVRDFRIKLW